MARRDQQVVDQLQGDVGLPAGAGAHNQPGGGGVAGPENELPGGGKGGIAVEQDQRSLGVEPRDGVDGEALRFAQPHLLADGADLERRVEVMDVADIAPQQVLEPGVAVESAPLLTELPQPGSDVGGGRVDGNGAGDDMLRVGKQLIAGEGQRAFRVAGAPTFVPGTQHPPIQHGGADKRAQRDHPAASGQRWGHSSSEDCRSFKDRQSSMHLSIRRGPGSAPRAPPPGLPRCRPRCASG